MRPITTHKTTATEQLTITANAPGPGGASHRYAIAGFDARKNPSAFGDDPSTRLAVVFQHGPIGEVGVNGVTHEALLAIVIDRLELFQAGEFACPENQFALERIREGMLMLQVRTANRIARGVEGVLIV